MQFVGVSTTCWWCTLANGENTSIIFGDVEDAQEILTEIRSARDFAAAGDVPTEEAPIEDVDEAVNLASVFEFEFVCPIVRSTLHDVDEVERFDLDKMLDSHARTTQDTPM